MLGIIGLSLAALLLLAVLFILFLNLRYGREKIEGRARVEKDGRYARLGNGLVHYECQGQEGSPVVVLVHGFIIPSFVWDPLCGLLCARGCRVLRFDLYGRGFSDRPPIEHTADLYARQLKEMADRLGIREKLVLAGFSMGAIVCSRFFSLFPSMVERIVFISPIGLGKKHPVLSGMFRNPLLKILFEAALANPFILVSLKVQLGYLKEYGAYKRRFLEQFRYAGIRHTLFSCIRNVTFEDFSDDYRAIGRSGIPVDLAWGTRDTIAPYGENEVFLRYVPQAVFHPMEGMRHLVPLEAPGKLASLFPGKTPE
jgi:pimeloyl-ACP methyl ester carboxylesterase